MHGVCTNVESKNSYSGQLPFGSFQLGPILSWEIKSSEESRWFWDALMQSSWFGLPVLSPFYSGFLLPVCQMGYVILVVEVKQTLAGGRCLLRVTINQNQINQIKSVYSKT